MLYGFSAIIAIAILYGYRSTSDWVRDRQYLVYGLGSLFIMGLGIRSFPRLSGVWRCGWCRRVWSRVRWPGGPVMR